MHPTESAYDSTIVTTTPAKSLDSTLHSAVSNCVLPAATPRESVRTSTVPIPIRRTTIRSLWCCDGLAHARARARALSSPPA